MEEETTAKILTISDLTGRSRPRTGASSLNFSRSISLSKSQPSDQPPKPAKTTSQNPSPRILKSLNHPAVVIGTLTLPSHHNANDSIQCSCFQFTDGSATICCDILDFHPEMIGKKIRVLAWNFIPLKCSAKFGGFLEIIRWEYLDGFSNLTSFSLSPVSVHDCNDNLKAKHLIFGLLESVSPISLVPYSTSCGSSGSDSGNLCGFLLKVLICECKLCRCKDSGMALQNLNKENHSDHLFMKASIVYFCGSASSWHPVILRLVGTVVLLSGLKKKLVYIGKEESQVMYVTTYKSFLHTPKFQKKCISNEKAEKRGLGEVGSYAGTVTGIYMQGMVVELDQEFLLLLTDHQLTVPHSLRVGAIVSVRNVHFVKPKFSWTTVLILGACFLTSIFVESFSPLETGCHKKSVSQNILHKFVDSLAFSARLWYFQKEGLAQTYITSCLPSSVYRLRHGTFVEYCKHDLCACDSEDRVLLKLVVPISCLASNCETRWMKMLLDWENGCDIMGAINRRNYISCCGRSCAKLIRRIFSAEDTGFVLLGILKVSSTSGRLQLVDATGSIDVVVPDIPSTWDSNRIYEIEDFTVIMQGVPHKLDQMDLFLGESFTFRSIFGGAQLERKTKLSCYLYYKFKDQKPRHDIYSPCTQWQGSFQEPEGVKYHLLRLEHKFPLLHELLVDQGTLSRLNVFAEAIIMPWDLTFAKKDEVAHLAGLPLDELRNAVKYSSRDNFEDGISLKRCKTIETFSKFPNTGSGDTGSMMYGLSGGFGCNDPYAVGKYCEPTYLLKFACLISTRSSKAPCLGFLHCRDAKAMTGSGCKPDGSKILLEFDSKSLCMYQGLRIGAYYIVKHQEKDLFCTSKDNCNVSGSSVLITSKMHLQSLTFTSVEAFNNPDSTSSLSLCNSFVSNNKAIPDDSQNFQSTPPISYFVSPEICSDINLFMPSDVISYLKVDMKTLQSSLVKPFVSFEEEADRHNVVSLPFSGASCSHLLLPEGNLVSLHGHVMAVHDFNHNDVIVHIRNESSASIHQPIVSQETSSICIHVLVGYHMARILGPQSKHVYPTGFGESVHATFHRVLVTGEENQYMLTPASFIVLNSANFVDYKCIDETYPIYASSIGHDVADLPAALISDITHSVDFKPIQLRCRVVSLYILVLENKRKGLYSKTRVQSWSPVLDIPLASFILDDGSSSCCCWANHERAATLLKLHFEAISHQAHVGTLHTSKVAVIGKACDSSVAHLTRILRQHGRVIVKNCGSTFDSSGIDLVFSVGSEKALSRCDEDFLRCLILDACFSTLWTIVGSLVDSADIYQLEKQVTELEMAILPLQNIWASRVFQSDPLAETRKIYHELLNN